MVYEGRKDETGSIVPAQEAASGVKGSAVSRKPNKTSVEQKGGPRSRGKTRLKSPGAEP